MTEDGKMKGMRCIIKKPPQKECIDKYLYGVYHISFIAYGVHRILPSGINT
jgi:hypothetical protein